MTETPPQLSIYEKTFAKSDKTDAILVVDGKKLHVNKAVLSYHSDYFNDLFNSGFKEKSIEEIEIKDVNFEKFATVLSLVQSAPIRYTERWEQLDSLLEIADRFQLSAVKRHFELSLETWPLASCALIEIADKYQLNSLMDRMVSIFRVAYYSKLSINEHSTRANKPDLEFFEKLSDETNIKFFHRFLELKNSITKPTGTFSEYFGYFEHFQRIIMSKTPEMSIYEKAFVKSDKTDGILVIDGKEMHVNKTVLSYHSDYFNALFNSDFKEKSMEKIEIREVNFEEFATLLSMVHLNPISPTTKNAMNILELSDRFILPCARYYLESFLILSQLTSLEKIQIGEKYELSELFQNGMITLHKKDFMGLPSNRIYQALSSGTKKKLFHKSLECFKT